VVTRVEQRRRWTVEEKLRLVAATREPGSSVSEVARRAGVPRLNELRSYLDLERARLPAKSKLAGAIRYSLVRWAARTRYVDDGRVDYLFAGSDAGGERAAVIYSLIETAKLNAINPHTWLSDVIGRIADHPARHIDQLLPWNWSPR
jgi:hypothetical protein